MTGFAHARDDHAAATGKHQGASANKVFVDLFGQAADRRRLDGDHLARRRRQRVRVQNRHVEFYGCGLQQCVHAIWVRFLGKA